MENNTSKQRWYSTWAQQLGRRDLVRAAFFATLLGGMLAHIPSALASGRWFGHHGRHHGRWGCGHRSHLEDVAEVRDHAQRAVRWALKSVDATPEQLTQAAVIVGRAVDDVFPLMQEHRRAHEAIAAALLSTAVDRDALRSLRQTEMERWSVATEKLTEAIADLADTLTPEQRRQLHEHFES